MVNKFEVATDKSGRINHYFYPDFPNVHIAPKDMLEHMNGNERIMFKGAEYVLFENQDKNNGLSCRGYCPSENSKIGFFSKR